MSRAKLLSDLQEIDVQRDTAIARLTVVVTALRGNPAIAAAQRDVDESTERLAEVERQFRLHDIDRQDVKDHIAREEQTLYSGKVKVPKELESLQMEIDSLKRRLGDLDDTALEIMMARDEASDSVTQSTATLAQVTADSASETASLTEEKAELKTTIRGLDVRRAKIAAGIGAADLALYDKLRPTRGGRAVAVLKGENCGACGMQLPRNDLEDVKAGQKLVQCSGCYRLLLG